MDQVVDRSKLITGWCRSYEPVCDLVAMFNQNTEIYLLEVSGSLRSDQVIETHSNTQISFYHPKEYIGANGNKVIFTYVAMSNMDTVTSIGTFDALNNVYDLETDMFTWLSTRTGEDIHVCAEVEIV